MLGFSSGGSPSGANDVRFLLKTVQKTDAMIAKMRLDIANGVVANEGQAMQQVRLLERENNQRKAWLHQHGVAIKALERQAGPITPMRDSFMTPDGPRHRGNRRAPITSIIDLQRQRGGFAPRVTPPTPKVDPAKAIGKKAAVPPSFKLDKTTDAITLATQIAAEKNANMVKQSEYMKLEQQYLRQGKALQAQRVRNKRLQEQYKAHLEDDKKWKQKQMAQVTQARANAEKAREMAKRRAQQLTAARLSHKAELEKLRKKPVTVVAQKTETRVQDVRTPTKTAVKVAPNEAPGGKQLTDDRNRAAREAFWVKLQGEMGKTWEKLKRDASLPPNQFVKENSSGWESRDLLLSLQSLTKQLVMDVNNLATRWVNGSILMTSAEFQAALGKLYQAFQADGARLMESALAVEKANSQPKTVVQSKPGDINVPQSTVKAAQAVDKRVTKNQRRNQLRNQRQFKAMGQSTENLGAAFPALRASMQGVLRK